MNVAVEDAPMLVDAGATCSHVPLLFATAVAVSVAAFVLVDVIVKSCVAGTSDPAGNVKLNCAGFEENGVAPVVFEFASTCTTVVPVAVTMLMKPVSVGAVSFVGSTETVNVCGVVMAPLGLTVSQLPDENAVAVNAVTPDDDVILTDCAAGVEPDCELNVSVDGVTVSPLCAIAHQPVAARQVNKDRIMFFFVSVTTPPLVQAVRSGLGGRRGAPRTPGSCQIVLVRGSEPTR